MAHDKQAGPYQHEMARAIASGEIEGVPFRVVGDGVDIEPGDTYIAERNSGLKLLTCREHNRDQRWIVPEEAAYLYDTWECLKIELDM